MKRILTKEFWNTPIIDMKGSDRKLVFLVLFGMFITSVIIAGTAAWRILYQ